MRLAPLYDWLELEPGPRILLEALKLYGTVEVPGAKNSPIILGWAAELGGWIASYYQNDEIPWCGLFVGIAAKRAGFPHTQQSLSAGSWLTWGREIERPVLGNVLVFQRAGGAHVGLYVGEDDECYHVLGGNQTNAVCIARLQKGRFLGARSCAWRNTPPKNIRAILLKKIGDLSTNEA